MPDCSICAHEARNDIDADLLGGATVRDVEGRHSVSKSAVDRHRRRCLGPRAARAIARFEELSVERLRGYATGLVEESMLGVLKAKREMALSPDDPSPRAEHRAYMDSARRSVELVGKLGGILGSSTVVAVDARRQTAVLANLTEDELRALARSDSKVIERTAREVIES